MSGACPLSIWDGNPLAEILGVRYPIIQAPMAGGPTTPELVAAVSEAGGLGRRHGRFGWLGRLGIGNV